MTASLETLVVTAYIFADGVVIPRPGLGDKTTDAELIAFSVTQSAMGIASANAARPDRSYVTAVPGHRAS
jgi:hypothetical protein